MAFYFPLRDFDWNPTHQEFESLNDCIFRGITTGLELLWTDYLLQTGVQSFACLHNSKQCG